MKKLMLTFLFFAAFGPIAAIAGEWTNGQTILSVEYDGDADTLWIKGIAAWTSANCSSATWIRVSSNVTGRKQMFAMVQAAQLGEKTISFFGECDSNTTIFNAGYVKVQ